MTGTGTARMGTAALPGVDDAGGIRGLAADYATLTRPDRDGFERHLMQSLSAGLGTAARRFVGVTFADIDGKDVCVASVGPADAPVYLKEGGDARLYLRTGNATTPLPLDEAVQYVRSRWPVRTAGRLAEAVLGRQT
jgi:hypothetical protein